MNDYVATAASEKRLREVLADKLGRDYDVEEIALTLLYGAKIEYKARAKQVTITLDLPESASPKRPEPSTGIEIQNSDGVTQVQETDAEIVAEVTTPAPPTPHIVPFEPRQFAEPDFEDVHYD